MSTSSTEELVEKLTKAIVESSIRLMSETEVAQEVKLTEGEFMARAKTFIKDPKSSIPSGEQAAKLTLAILAKQHRRRIPTETAHRLMAPLLGPEPTAAAPLPHAAKKRKVAVLKKAIAKKAPVKTVMKTPAGAAVNSAKAPTKKAVKKTK